jgi:hypothetical protein
MPADRPDEPNDVRVLAGARDRCRRLLDDLRRDADGLRRPTPQVGAGALAEGVAAHDRAAAAAEALLRRLGAAPGE